MKPFFGLIRKATKQLALAEPLHAMQRAETTVFVTTKALVCRMHNSLENSGRCNAGRRDNAARRKQLFLSSRGLRRPKENGSKMRIGYARTSTESQNLDIQKQALTKAGCERIFDDPARSGAQADRPGLKKAIRALQPGDTLVVQRFDRLARSVPDLSNIISNLQKRGIGFVSLTEAIDTTTEVGLMILYVLGAIAQFERALIRERVAAGLATARANGTRLGRRPSLTAEQRAEIRALVSTGSERPDELAKRYDVHLRTIRRCLLNDINGP
ncbi:recombinase family protein [Rhizobium leguminosarum]|nr:recombinase family protein [Rhizobium leguminosarum]